MLASFSVGKNPFRYVHIISFFSVKHFYFGRSCFVSFHNPSLLFYFIVFLYFFFRVTCEPFVKGGELNKSDREE